MRLFFRRDRKIKPDDELVSRKKDEWLSGKEQENLEEIQISRPARKWHWLVLLLCLGLGVWMWLHGHGSRSGSEIDVLGTDELEQQLALVAPGEGLSKVDPKDFDGEGITLKVGQGRGIEVSENTVSTSLYTKGGLTYVNKQVSLLNNCANDEVLKWSSTNQAWQCAADKDSDTDTKGDSKFAFGNIDVSSGTDPLADTLSDTLQVIGQKGVKAIGDAKADSLTLIADLDSKGGLTINKNSTSLLRNCSAQQILKWDGTEWKCSDDAGQNLFKTIETTSGNDVVADNMDDVLQLNAQAGGGLAVTGDKDNDAVEFSLVRDCTTNYVLKWNGSSWACAEDIGGGTTGTAQKSAYQQHLAGADDISIGTSLTPLLTDGAGTAQSLELEITNGNEISYVSTIEVAATASVQVTYSVIRDDNEDNDCVTGGGDGTQVGGSTTAFASAANNFTTTLSFTDTAPGTTTPKYQLCASASIGTTASAEDRSLRLSEVAI